MIKFIKTHFKNSDNRGHKSGIINEGNWKELCMTEAKQGTIRSNHYHSSTKELFIILEGEVDVTLQQVDYQKIIGDTESHIVKKNDIFIIEPCTNHIFNIIKSAKWISALSNKLDTDNPDIHKL